MDGGRMATERDAIVGSLRASMAASLVPAALAETPEALCEAWSRWRSGKDRIERLAGVDYKLLPQVWPRIDALGIEDPLTRVFRGVRKRIWTRNWLLIAEAATLQQKLEAEGIASVLMKGPSLLAGAYGYVGDRPTADIDLLVAPTDFERATRVLRPGRDTVACDAHATTLSGTGLFALDLHRCASQLSIMNGVRRIDDAVERGAIARRCEVAVGRHKVWVPEPTDRLYLHLANVFAHGARLDAQSALWMADARACVEVGGIDYARLAGLVEAQGAVALFQHHLGAFREFAPQALNALFDTVLALPQSARDRPVAEAMMRLETRHREDAPADPFRAQWFALRGEDEATAPTMMRLRYVLDCAANVGRTVALSPRSLTSVFKAPGYYWRRTIGALSG